MIEEIPTVPSPQTSPNEYDKLLDAERKRAEKKLGDKLLVEDDFIKPGDFRDLERHRMLEEKAKKNVIKAEK